MQRTPGFGRCSFEFCLSLGFPVLPVWLSDATFGLFKSWCVYRSTTYFPASGIWFLVNLVCTNLLQGPLTPEAAI